MRTLFLRKLSYLLLLTTILSGCLSDAVDEIPGGGTPGTDADGMLHLSLQIPGAYTSHVSTYADIMDAEEECQITTIDVLVFNDANGEFLYHEQGVNIQQGSNVTTRNFDMKIRQTTDPRYVQLMILANVSDIVETAIQSGKIVENITTRDEVMELLVFDLPVDKTSENLGGKWLVKPGRYTLFPMWGLSEVIDLNVSSITVDPIILLRAVAKVDIGLNFTGTGSSEAAQGLNNTFYLEEFHLYNALNKLQVAPSVGNYNETDSKVTAPSIPTGATTFDPNVAISYKRRAYRGTAGYHDFLNEIYLAEHPKGSQDDRLNNACIVIGGRFGTNATTTATAKITYYRIDFVEIIKESDGTVIGTEFLPVLRNHRYRINITAVKDRGYDTKEEAFAAMGINTNLEVEIENRNEKITNYQYDGQYALGVSTNAFTVDKNGATLAYAREIDIDTNYEAGWTAVATGATWITFVQANGTSTGTTMTGAVGESKLKFVVAAGTAARTGTITIQAGRLFQTITVTQTAAASVEVISKDATYPMNGTTWTLRMKTSFPWKARVGNDPYNIIRSFTPEGVSNTTTYGQTFSFTFINEVLMNALPSNQKTQKVTLEIYSPDDPPKFDPYGIELTASTTLPYYDMGLNYYVYKTDQATSQSWYVYANLPNNTNDKTIPVPWGANQQMPARANSCASIGDNWRLPTETELKAIHSYSINNGGIAAFGFTANIYYWTATSASSANNAMALYMNASGSMNNAGKTVLTYRARCVRTKNP